MHSCPDLLVRSWILCASPSLQYLTLLNPPKEIFCRLVCCFFFPRPPQRPLSPSVGGDFSSFGSRLLRSSGSQGRPFASFFLSRTLASPVHVLPPQIGGSHDLGAPILSSHRGSLSHDFFFPPTNFRVSLATLTAHPPTTRLRRFKDLIRFPITTQCAIGFFISARSQASPTLHVTISLRLPPSNSSAFFRAWASNGKRR